ncbi:unnamed protein product [Thlaspi arvense]|uniref:Uncharacterized protein n=1 Tax=Thlaspi arvense TaxID=13288 RepID=A0AAU9T710_THLAR|nr:unnamed protein product [Thlaspi arvense]
MVMGALEYLRWRLRPRRGPDRKFDGFDAKGYERLRKEVCNDRSSCRAVVILYAKMGLHRYNFVEGKNYQFCRVEKYNRTANLGAASYYITLVAMNPSDPLPQYFLIQISEVVWGVIALMCCISVPRDDPHEDPLFGTFSECSFDYKFPEWPSENYFKDTKRFYVVKKSELQDEANESMIRLYLELAVATDRTMFSNNDDLSKLKIRKVAIESTQDPNAGLKAKNATFYISYMDPSNARVGKHVDRIAKVRRSFDEKTGCLHFLGFNRRFKTKPKKARKSRKSVQPLFSVFKPWRLSSPRRRKTYRNRGVGFSSCLHKTRSIRY